MRPLFFIPLLGLLALPAVARSAPPDISPSVETNRDADRNEARWAHLEAQARIADGDYDGAVQAEKQSEAARDKADRRDMATRAPKRP